MMVHIEEEAVPRGYKNAYANTVEQRGSLWVVTRRQEPWSFHEYVLAFARASDNGDGSVSHELLQLVSRDFIRCPNQLKALIDNLQRSLHKTKLSVFRYQASPTNQFTFWWRCNKRPDRPLAIIDVDKLPGETLVILTCSRGGPSTLIISGANQRMVSERHIAAIETRNKPASTQRELRIAANTFHAGA